MTRKGLTPLSSIKLSVFNKAGIFILLSLIVIPSKTYAQKINTERFFDSKLGREVEVVEGEIIVRFKRGLEVGAIRKTNEAFGNRIRKEIKNMNIHRIKLGKGRKIENMLNMYRKNPNVLFAEPNYIAKALATTPNDPSFSQQWGLAKIYAPEAWDIEKGNPDVIIGMVDTGIDLDHPDLDEKIISGYDFVNEDSEPMDDNGHGTHCAGIAAAESNNSQGITGVAWRSKLMPVKVLDFDGAGTYSDVAEGIIYAADNGAKVINLSLGAYSYSQTLQDAVDYAYQKGCVIVAAAGNDNTNEPLYPAACNNIIGVAATDQNDERWTSSNYGDYIDVSAPGVNIYSTSLNNIYSSANGTSASAPFVSGLAALLLSQNSTLANYEVENRIRQSADDLSTAGRDDYYGYGRINTYNALVNEPNAVHDGAIIGLDVEPLQITTGESTTVTVIIENQGNYLETNVEVTLFLDNKQIGKMNHISLVPDERKSLTFSWVPTASASPQSLKATISILPNEEDKTDNIKLGRYYIHLDASGQVSIIHKKIVHQYVCTEAYNLYNEIESQYLYSGASMSDDREEDKTICGGAYAEDGETPFDKKDHVYHLPFPTNTLAHFWSADAGDSSSGLVGCENAWQKARKLWEGWSDDPSEYPDGAIDRYKAGDKGRAYDYLGHIAHLLVDMSEPAHAHKDSHTIYDECFEDWMGNNANYGKWFVSGDKIKRFSWESAEFDASLITIPWNKRPSGMSKSIFPLYYLMYTINQYADYFADDADAAYDGDTYQRSDRSGWVSYFGWPNHPTKVWHLNTANTVSGAYPSYPVGGNKDNDAGDNDDDKDLTLIGDKTYVYAIRAVATLYKFFWKNVKDDGYEDNDTYSSANTLDSGSYTGLKCLDDDWYKIQMWSSQNISATITFPHIEGDLDMKLYNPSVSQIDSSTSSSDNETVNANSTGDGYYYVKVYSYDGAAQEYNMTITADDGYENNDTSSAASTLTSGTYYRLRVSDDDWYKVYLNKGDSISATINFTHSWGNLDMRLYNPGLSQIDSSASTSNSETVNKSYVTTAGYYYIKVYGYGGAKNSKYSLSIIVTSDTTPPDAPVSLNATPNTWTNNNSFSINWTNPSDPSGIAGAYYKRGSAPTSNSNYDGYTANKPFSIPATSQGGQKIYVWLKDGAGNRDYTKNSYTWLYYDGTDPGLVSNLQSTSHNTYSWSKDKTIDVSWSAAGDNGGSELDGYSIEWSHSSSTLPDTIKDIEQNVTNTTSPSLTDDNDWYFHIRSVDNAGNWDNTAKHLGAFYIDTTSPSSSVNPLSEYMTTPSFTISWSGSDGPGCNIESYDIQYKDGAGTWTNWLINTTLTSKTFGPTSPILVQDKHTYYFRCRAKDKLDNQESYPGSADTSTTVDLTPPNAPIVSSTSHNEDEWNITNNDPLFNWTVPPDFSGIDGFSFELNHTENYTPDKVKDCEETTTSKQYINVSDGIWYFHIRAKDNAGNWGATDTYGPVKIDLTAPAFLTISSSADPAKEGNITITVVASEQMSVVISSVTQNVKSPTLIDMNSSDYIIWTGTYTVVSGYDGTATISVSGKDLAGKQSSDLTTFVVDTVPPTKSEISSTTHPENTPTSNSNPSFTWTNSTDVGGSGVAGYSYALNQIEDYNLDVATETTGTSASFTKPDGTWWFHLRGVDNAGNGSEIDQYKFIIDTTSPTFTASSSKDPAKEGDVTITVQANEELKKAPTVNVKQKGQGSATTVKMNKSDSITWTGTYPVVPGYDGTAVIDVSGVDLADNIGTGSGSFEVDTIAPTASISIFPTVPLKTGEFQIELTITDASNIPEKPSLGYTPSGGSLISIPLTGSEKNWSGSSYIESTTPEGMATFTFSANDAAGNKGTTIIAGKNFEIDTTIDVSSGGVSSNSDGTMVNVPQDAFPENVNIRITYPDPTLPEIREADINIIDDKGIKPVKTGNLYRQVVAVGDISGNEIESSDKPVTISIPYPDGDQDGMVDGTTVKEKDLRMFLLDETLKKWNSVPNYQVDASGNNVSAEVNKFSIYALMEWSPPDSLSGVFGYPNPCYVRRQGYVRISNIPLKAKDVKIYIYNIAGELVRVLEEDEEIETLVGSKIGKWDGRNEDKEMVASGIYIYLIKSQDTKKTEKIAIFW